MNRLLAVLSGVIIPVSVMMNGMLAESYGGAFSIAFLHLTGILVSLLYVLARRRPKAAGEPVPLRLWVGGLIGVFTVNANNATFAALGVSLTVALGLVGQCALSLIIDTFGWFGLPKQRLSARRVAGLGIIICGIAVMLAF